MVELSDEEKHRVFQMKTVESKTYKQIVEQFADEGKTISDNQVREAVRWGTHSKEETAIQARIDVLGELKKAMGELNDLLGLAKQDKEWATAISAVNSKMKVIEIVIRSLGKWDSPKTQINILVVEREQKFREKIYEWLIRKLPKEFLDEFQGFVGETEKVLDGEYKLMSEDKSL